MFNLLEKLRTQSSRAQRTFIAFSLSLLFTGLVFVMWLTTQKNTKNLPESASVAQNTASNTPTDTLLKNAQDMWASVVGASAELTSTIKNTDFSSTIEYSNSSSTSSTSQQN
ncbi:MAG: hypothetical protein RL292_464 [Candidatus Parcubacteria bacterium]|jgi:hypothetical protein